MVYQFKITLKDLKPPVWRSALIVPTMTMEELHYVTQSLMGWSCEHLYQFSSGKRRIVDSEEDGDEDSEFSSDILVGQAFRKVGDSWTYLYDFGDSWEHEIELEKILDLDPGVEYPVCLDGARACPPEDCGGVMGYLNMLSVLKNPKDPEYKEMLEWLGEGFDSEYFSKDEVNSELHDPDNWVDEDEDLDFEDDGEDGEEE
jgi:hypothetical protein